MSSLLRTCDKCPLHSTTDRVGIGGVSSCTPIPVMVVGEAPGKTEESLGIPFTGQAGSLLRSMLKKYGLTHAYLTNAVRCRPPGNRTPKTSELNSCRHWMDLELKQQNPSHVLLLGNTACASLIGMKGIHSLRGKPVNRDGITYFPTYHPAYILRDETCLAGWERDIARFSDLVFNRETKDISVNPVIIDSWDQTTGVFREIRAAPYVALDIETSGINPWEPGAYIASVGIATCDQEFIFLLNHAGCALENDFLKQSQLVYHLRKKVNRVIAQNGKFDTLWLKKIFGTDFRVDFDTMLAHYAIDENSRHGLEKLAEKYLGVEPYDIPLRIKTGKGNVNVHALYLAKDVRYTYELWKIFQLELHKDSKTRRVFRELLMPMSEFYKSVEYNGFYVDPVRLKQADEYWTERRAHYHGRLKKYGQINYNSPKQVAQLLFDDLNIDPVEKTKRELIQHRNRC